MVGNSLELLVLIFFLLHSPFDSFVSYFLTILLSPTFPPFVKTTGYEVIGVPLESIWLDIDHTYDKRYLEWDEAKFPDASRLVTRLKSRGRRLVPIVDPHLKVDGGYSVYREANEKNLLIYGPKGDTYQGKRINYAVTPDVFLQTGIQCLINHLANQTFLFVCLFVCVCVQK